MLFRQVATLDAQDPERCKRLFKSNHYFGMILFAGLSMSLIWQIVVISHYSH